MDLSKAFDVQRLKTVNDDSEQRNRCIFNAERELPCGSVVNEREGRIIAKTSFQPAG